jgi:hypothetical protein
VIPNPVTIPDDTPLPTPLDAEAAEAAALAALNDEPKAQEDPAKKLIPVECPHCNFKWTEPLERGGKNTLCKNPDCKQRIKIPEPKDDAPTDWRHLKTKGPTLAKKNFEKPTDIQDAADTKQLSDKTIREKILDQEIEPRPLKQKVMFVLLALGLLAGVVFGVMYMMQSRTEGKEDRLMQEAQDEFTRGAEGYAKEEAPLLSAVLFIAGGEHAVRHNTKDKLKEAMDQFARAREVLRTGTSPGRNALCGELAVAILVLGGSEEQAKDQIRIRWTQETGGKYRPNEQVFNVFDELRKTLGLVPGVDVDFRTHLARRLTRELVKRGQGALAITLIPKALFSETEQPEAEAAVALEVYRAERGEPEVRAAAERLKGRPLSALRTAPSAQILFTALKTEKAPVLFGPPSGTGAVTDQQRHAYTGTYLLENKTDEALKLAQRPSSSPETQLRALILYAEWAVDPGPALDSALGLFAANKKEVKVSPYFALRLAQLAASAGRHEQAKQFALVIPDESLKTWALGDAVHLRLLAALKEKGDEGWLELPDDPKKLRAGHAWARLWIARQNTRLSGDRAAEVKVVSAWPTFVVPFGKAGVALGLQDK